MKRSILKVGSCLALILLVAGCDWEFTGSSDGVSDRYNAVNFSGVYRGSPLISDYTQTGTAGTDPIIESDELAKGNGTKTVFTGTIKNRPVVSGSLTVSANGIHMVDNGDGTFGDDTGPSGTINYNTGSWSIDFGGVPPALDTKIVATYQVRSGAGTTGSGATGVTIVSFTVTQEGDKIKFIDNRGSHYDGKLGSIRTTSGSSINTAEEAGSGLRSGDIVEAQFNVKGVSAAGKSVTMTGMFQCTVGPGGMLTDRTMIGSWIESKGRVGDINGRA